ncbi:BQ5605_C004g02942 [Microbotryum silenes-dioicae]|uniref:BQ5605_C004g02942 protein n=1 Tax=Microbotryum silenes-dioicae TaxID=796604 RepID=A0A2X0MWD7_9BASI|nr:BQ5605_C004g02942 [Microbotryum silenes-dioicae]
MSNPLPVSLPQECRKAAKLLNAFADRDEHRRLTPLAHVHHPTAGKGLDSIIPANVLRKAKVLGVPLGFAFLTVVKAGFVFSARAGSGVVIARLPDGSWSAPSACATAGGGVGFQVGVEMAEFIIILNSRAAVASFMAAGSISLGGNMSIAAGPIGRNVEGTGSISSKGKVAAMYSYSRTKGLFGGASIEGSVIVERSDANRQAYGFDVKAKQLLSGQVDPPAFADLLIDTIVRKSGGTSEHVQRSNSGDDDDNIYNDDDFENDSGHERGDSFGGDPKAYSFGSAYASGGSSSRPSTPGSPKMEKSLSSSKGFGSKLSNFVPGSASRSRSSSIATARAEIGAPTSSLMAKESSRDGPISTGTTRFETEFTNEFEQSDDPFKDGEHWRGSVDNRRSPAAKLTKASSPLTSYSSPRVGGPGIKDIGAVPEWEAQASLTRDSFDSLDDDRAERNGFGNRYDDGAQTDYGTIGGSSSSSGGRFRSSTVGSNTRPTGLFARARSASSPWSSKSKKAAAANARAASPYINERPSPFEDDDPSNKSTYSTRARSGSAGPAPWDSEEEGFYNTDDSPASRLRSSSRGAGRADESQQNITTTPRGERKDPFDFSEVDADFASSISSHHPGGAAGKRSGNSTPNRGRSRSGTIGGIGKAIALYDFPGVESTDLPFKKGDVITVLSCDDEEWWKGRLNLITGMFPRNRVEAHLDK